MATRTVSVELKAKLTEYIRGMKDAGEATADTRDQAEKLAAAGEKAVAPMDRFGKAMGGSGRVAKATAKDYVEMSGDLAKMDQQIKTTEAAITSLAKAFARGGDIKLLDDINEQRTKLKQLTDVRKLLPEPAEFEAVGKTFATRLVGSIGGSVASASATLGSSVGPTIGGAIGLAAAPVLASTIATALSATAAFSVLSAGVAAAISGDVELQNAGKAAAARFMSGLEDEAKVLRGPILESLDVLSDAGDRLNENLGRTLEALSDDLTPFTRKIVGAGEAVTGSLLGAARESGPALDGLGDAIVLLGDGVSTFIDLVADGGPEAAANLRMVAGVAADFLKVSGGVLAFLNDLSKIPGVSGVLPMLKDHYANAAEEAANLTNEQAKLEEALRAAEQAALDDASALVELAAVQKAQTDPVFGLMRAQQKLAAAQKAVTKAERDHGRSSPEYEEALRKATEAAIGLEGAAGKVAETSNGQLSPALRATMRAAGLTERQIADVAAQFVDAKGDAAAFARTWKANISAPGLAATTKGVKDLRFQITNLKGKTVTVTVRTLKTGDQHMSGGIGSGTQIKGAATGGPITGPGTATSDSIPAMLSNGEHVWTAAEVRAAGGHRAVESIRAGVMGGPAQSYAVGGQVAPARVMPAAAQQRMIVETRSVVEFAGGADQFGQMMLNVLRVKPGVRATMAKTLGVT